MKRYKFTMPTPELAQSMGIKFEGLETRTRLWLMGVAFGASLNDAPFNLFFTTRTSFSVETNAWHTLKAVAAHLEQYGFTMEETKS